MTNDGRRLKQSIESVGKPDGATSLHDAIFDALVYLKPYAGRRVLVIVSDGQDPTSRLPEHDFDNTLQRLTSDDCQVYVVQTAIYANANVRDLTADRRMQAFSTQTAGAAYIPPSRSGAAA